ncbi:hypothetical protein pb186bvf_004151 [Paramecium bursaria]
MKEKNDDKEDNKFEFQNKEQILYKAEKMKNYKPRKLPQIENLDKIIKIKQSLDKLPMGIDEILLKFEEIEFQREKNLSVNDIEKLKQDRKNYLKFLLKNNSFQFPNEIMNKQIRENQTRKIVKIDKIDKIDLDKENSSKASESGSYDSDFGTDQSDEDKVRNDDYD